MNEDALGYWIEWKEKCAHAKCAEKTQQHLTAFVFHRFKKNIPTAGQGKFQTPGSGQIRAAEAWHLFETYFEIHTTAEGKHYKNWLFDQIPPDALPLNAIEGRATGLVRSAVREFLRMEFALTSMDSIDRPITGTDGSGLTLHDLLPGTLDPAEEASLNEYRELGEKHAVKFEESMPEIEKVCVIAKHLRISLADNIVTELAGRKSSVLYETYRSFLNRLTATVSEEYAGEDPECIEILTASSLKALHELLFEQKKAEKEYAGLFTV